MAQYGDGGPNAHMEFPTMDRFGVNIGVTEKKRKNEEAKRLKKGECPTCGRKTHKVNPITRKKTALTVEGEVLYGHCLICKPIEGYAKRPPKPQVPHTVMAPIRDTDEESAVSGLTFDVTQFSSPAKAGGGMLTSSVSEGYRQEMMGSYGVGGIRPTENGAGNPALTRYGISQNSDSRNTSDLDDGTNRLGTAKDATNNRSKNRKGAVGSGSIGSDPIQCHSPDGQRIYFDDEDDTGNIATQGHNSFPPSQRSTSGGRCNVEPKRASMTSISDINSSNLHQPLDIDPLHMSVESLDLRHSEQQDHDVVNQSRVDYPGEGGRNNNGRFDTGIQRMNDRGITKKAPETSQSTSHGSRHVRNNSSTPPSTKRPIHQMNDIGDLPAPSVDHDETSRARSVRENLGVERSDHNDDFEGGKYANSFTENIPNEQQHNDENIDTKPHHFFRPPPPIDAAEAELHRKWLSGGTPSHSFSDLGEAEKLAETSTTTMNSLPTHLLTSQHSLRSNKTSPASFLRSSYQHSVRKLVSGADEDPVHTNSYRLRKDSSNYAMSYSSGLYDNNEVDSITEPLADECENDVSVRDLGRGHDHSNNMDAPASPLSHHQRSLHDDMTPTPTHTSTPTRTRAPTPDHTGNASQHSVGKSGIFSTDSFGPRRNSTAFDGGESVDHGDGVSGSNFGTESFSVVRQGGDMMQWAHDHKKDGDNKRSGEACDQDQSGKPPKPSLSLTRQTTWGTSDKSLARPDFSSFRQIEAFFDSSCDEDEEEEEVFAKSDDVVLRSSPPTIPMKRDASIKIGLGTVAECKADWGPSDSSTQGASEAGMERSKASDHAGENSQNKPPTGVETINKQKEESGNLVPQKQSEERPTQNKKVGRISSPHDNNSEGESYNETEAKLRKDASAFEFRNGMKSEVDTMNDEVRQKLESNTSLDGDNHASHNITQTQQQRKVMPRPPESGEEHDTMASSVPRAHRENDAREQRKMSTPQHNPGKRLEINPIDPTSRQNYYKEEHLPLAEHPSRGYPDSQHDRLSEGSSGGPGSSEDRRGVMQMFRRLSQEEFSVSSDSSADKGEDENDDENRLTKEKQSAQHAPLAKRKPQKIKRPEIEDIRHIVLCLKGYPDNIRVHERGYEAFYELATRINENGRKMIIKHKGVEAIVQGMWSHLDNVGIQVSALRALWGLLASAQAADDMKGLGSESGITDVLLISMQTHLKNPVIQEVGCGALKCLASATSVNDQIDDGTSSSAILCVVKSMEAHEDCEDVQDWGLRALYSFCSASDRNKDSFARSDAYGGSGFDVIHMAMRSFHSSLGVQEWACQLFWCLTSYERVANMLLIDNIVVQSILDAMQEHAKYGDAASLTTACCGALANLAVLADQSHKRLLNAGGVTAIIDVMLLYQQSKNLQVEACAALANLSVSKDVRMVIVRNGGVDTLLSSMHDFPDECILQGEACRALRCLCSDSDDAREAASLDKAIAIIVQAMERHRGSVVVQEMASGLLANLAMVEENQALIINAKGLNAIFTALRSHPKEKAIQQVCSSLLRYLSASWDSADAIASSGAINAIISTMQSNADSEEVQENACGIFWNLFSHPRKDLAIFIEVRGIKHIIKAMQTLPESVNVQKMACGALWSLVDGSIEAKDSVASAGGIDAILCAVAIHPYTVSIIEIACGVLASLSVVREHAAAILHGGGVIAIIEAMRANTSSTILLERGSLLLRNLASAGQKFANEAVSGVTTIIKGMDEHPDSVGVQREACGALWSLAANSEKCKERILLAGGVDAIIRCMEHNSCVSEIQDYGREAFQQLVG